MQLSGLWKETRLTACLLLGCLSAGAQMPVNGDAAEAVQDQAAITGSIVDIEGALVAGAQVQLLGADGNVSQETISGNDGRFRLRAGVDGTATLRVALQGFEPANQAVELREGQALALPAIVLRLSTAKFAVDVTVPVSEVAAAQVHAEERQRLFGFLPNFFVSYDFRSPPLTAAEKFHLATRDMIDPGNLLLVATVAGVQQASDSFEGYGQGAAGYGKRFGADYGNLEFGTLLGEAVFPSLLHQDPRYFYKGTGSVRSRAGYAMAFSVVRRGDNGKRQFAWAGVLGDLTAGALSNLYYPTGERGARLTLENGLLGIAGDALNGLFQEFFARKMTTNTKP